MILELFRWWYGAGWRRAAGSVQQWPRQVEQAFSAGILLQTLFDPWRRISGRQGRSLDDKMGALLDSLVSRAIGFFVRFFVLITAGLMLVAAALGGALAAAVWPVVPLACAVCVIKGVIG